MHWSHWLCIGVTENAMKSLTVHWRHCALGSLTVYWRHWLCTGVNDSALESLSVHNRITERALVMIREQKKREMSV